MKNMPRKSHGTGCIKGVIRGECLGEKKKLYCWLVLPGYKGVANNYNNQSLSCCSAHGRIWLSLAVPWHLLLLTLLLSFRGSWVLSSPCFPSSLFPEKPLLAQLSAASIPCNHEEGHFLNSSSKRNRRNYGQDGWVGRGSRDQGDSFMYSIGNCRTLW